MGVKNSKLIEANRPVPNSPARKSLESIPEPAKTPDNMTSCCETIPIPVLAPLELESIGPPPLTEEQCVLLAETWKELESNIAKVGVITFISLFETHPDVQQTFMPFSGMGLEELKQSKQLRAHALRVMAFVQKAVARLHEPEKLEALLRDLGQKHYFYGAKPEYVELIGPQFIQAIRPSLEYRWTEELQDTWLQLFRYISDIMMAAIKQESLNHSSNNSVEH